MFNPFTRFFAPLRDDDTETLARRARARYDAMSSAANPEAADFFEKRRLEKALSRMSEEFEHPSDWPRPARVAPPSTFSGYPLAAAEDKLSKLLGLPITQDMRDRFYADVAKGQSAYDDAGTTYERHYRAMLGLPVEEPVTHREYVKTMVNNDFRNPFAKALANVAALQKAEQEVIAAAIAFVDGPAHSAQEDFDRLEAATAIYSGAKDALRHV